MWQHAGPGDGSGGWRGRAPRRMWPQAGLEHGSTASPSRIPTSAAPLMGSAGNPTLCAQLTTAPRRVGGNINIFHVVIGFFSPSRGAVVMILVWHPGVRKSWMAGKPQPEPEPLLLCLSPSPCLLHPGRTIYKLPLWGALLTAWLLKDAINYSPASKSV